MVEVSWWNASWGRVVNKFIDVYHEDVEARTRGNGSVSWLRIWVWLWPPLILERALSLNICKKRRRENVRRSLLVILMDLIIVIAVELSVAIAAQA